MQCEWRIGCSVVEYWNVKTVARVAWIENQRPCDCTVSYIRGGAAVRSEIVHCHRSLAALSAFHSDGGSPVGFINYYRVGSKLEHAGRVPRLQREFCCSRFPGGPAGWCRIADARTKIVNDI